MIDTTSPNYSLDDATLRHLNAWADTALRDDERDTVVEAIIRYLEGGSVDDAEYSLAHGWSHVHDLVALNAKDVHELTIDETPARFRSGVMFEPGESGQLSRAEFRDWLGVGGVFYYARPHESFFPAEARKLAARACCSKLWLEDLS